MTEATQVMDSVRPENPKLTRHWKRSCATFVKRSHALSTQVLLSFYLHNVTWNTIQLPIPLTIQKCVNGMKHIRIEIVGKLPPLYQYSMYPRTYARTYVRMRLERDQRCTYNDFI